MKPENLIALVVTYYLSKYDSEAYANLGYKTYGAAHKDIGRRLGVKPSSINNMRDEFDPIHDNPRAGWYQREMRPSRKRIVQAFQDLDENELRTIVQEMLETPHFADSDEGMALLASIDTTNEDLPLRAYGLRGVTGQKAEEYFLDYYAQTGEPCPGQLYDTREQGTGYDFHIISNSNEVFVEVKGLSGETGGISFTNKEWQAAIAKEEQYFLAVVRNVSTNPGIQFIQNPGRHLAVNKNIFTVVQIQWSARL